METIPVKKGTVHYYVTATGCYSGSSWIYQKETKDTTKRIDYYASQI